MKVSQKTVLHQRTILGIIFFCGYVLLLVITSSKVAMENSEIRERFKPNYGLQKTIVSPSFYNWKNIAREQQHGPQHDGQKSHDRKFIRKWGCHRTETPFIYVHIGKAGGSSIVRRIEAASLNYTNSTDMTNAYYPVEVVMNHSLKSHVQGGLLEGGREPISVRKARFSKFEAKQFRPRWDDETFEGTMVCNATTPLGQAIACPMPISHHCNTNKKDDDPCYLVYSGHGSLGEEMHWLPPRYLQQWWKTQWGTATEVTAYDGDSFPTSIRKRSNSSSSSSATAQIDKLLLSLSTPRWCFHGKRNVMRAQLRKTYRSHYERCSKPLESIADLHAIRAVFGNSNNHENSDTTTASFSWSPVYASLPVLRATVVRDPFTWLLSKFFWHGVDMKFQCNDVSSATAQIGSQYIPSFDSLDSIGWARRFSMSYITMLCGVDCIVRWAAATMGRQQEHQSTLLDELVNQAEDNIRHSFALVGLLNETDVFFDMVSKRVQYMDTSLNQNVKGPRNPSGATKECQDLYKNPEFQSKLIQASPEIAALDHLYKVAVEVNRFQINELQQCKKR